MADGDNIRPDVEALEQALEAIYSLCCALCSKFDTVADLTPAEAASHFHELGWRWISPIPETDSDGELCPDCVASYFGGKDGGAPL